MADTHSVEEHLRSGLLVLLSLAASTLFAQTPATADKPAYEADPRFVSAWKDARDLEHHHQYNFAADAYKKANKVADGKCLACLKKTFELQTGMGNYKDALKVTDEIAASSSEPAIQSLAQLDRASVIVAQAGDKPKPAQLEAAHTAYQAALTAYPKNNSARYGDACVLARMGRNDDAGREFAACAAQASPTDPMRNRALHFAENPALSMNKMAPPFEVTTFDGAKFNLDDMQGRVVLIDFWATWCGPCNEELPHLAKFVQKFKDEPLVVISISVDKDEAKWKEFVARHEMTWVQYRDADGSISNRFGNNLIPSYYMIGSDGVILKTQRMGSDDDVEGKLKKLLKQAREEPRPVSKEVATASN